METLKKICSQLEDCVLGELGKDKSQIDAKELGEVVDAIKDIKMAIYYASITDAMEKSEYGKDYDENGKFYTQPRNMNGQFRRSYMYYEPDLEQSRDMDRGMGRMYYTDRNNMSSNNYGSSNNRGYSESRYDRARRGYEESKQTNPNSDNMDALEQVMDAFEEDINKLKSKMTQNEKTIARNRLNNISDMM